LYSCSSTESQDKLFQHLSPEHTHVTFANTIEENDSINILNYEYLYNGGGVGIADFNNDDLPDIFFSGNMVPSRLYVNAGNFLFKDITLQSGIDTRGNWVYGVSIVDINQDGWQDIYLSVGGIGNEDMFPNKLYINKGDLTFEESSEEYGLDDFGESIQAAFLDYDNDGDLDMYLLTGGGFEKSAITSRPILKDGAGRNTDRLYRNDFDKLLGHPVFTNVSAEAGILIEGFGLGVSILDVNEDGWPDIYVTNDYLSRDHLYSNNQDGTFSDKVDQYLKHTSHFAMGNDVGDLNNDGRLDIVALDMLPEDNYRRKLMFGPNQYDKFYLAVGYGYGYQYMRNTLQIKNADGTFSEIGQFAGIDKTDWSWAPLIADFDNDGLQDLVISNGYGKDVTDLDFVKFRQNISGLSNEKRKQALLDSLKVRPGIIVPNYAYKNNGDNTFTKVSEEWGFNTASVSNGMAYADLDNDGDLDLVVNNIDQAAFVYKNNLIERGKNDSNFLRVKLFGPDQNKNGFGALVSITGTDFQQVRLHNPVRGFQSSVENVIHFGLGNNHADTLIVKWSDGRMTMVVSPPINKVIDVLYANSEEAIKSNDKINTTLLLEDKRIAFKHTENDFNDFVRQPLLPHKLSQEGPGIAVGDINSDGLEDIYIGGSYRLPAHIMIQNAKGEFIISDFENDLECEDMGALLFDADNDGDNDLYVVSGGVEYYENHNNYQDRLYINKGHGEFIKDVAALPKITASGSCVVAADYDGDGDLDLFVGGRAIPDKYPQPPRSYVLKNDRGKFEDVTEKIAPGLKQVGMVTSALWTDFDNDNRVDLVVAGEAMPIKLFKNLGDHLEEVSSGSGLDNSDGFWNGLVAGDFDNDGDMDYVAGNLGLNGPMHASIERPITIYYADYDGNGSVEPLIGYFESGVNFPIPSLDILTSQLPSLKKSILYHRAYAQNSLDDLVKLTGNKSYETLYCKTLESSVIWNEGQGKFKITPLPKEAQLAPIYGLMAEDINNDGNLDLLGVGNSYSPEIVYGRYDALIGVTFLGPGKNFRFMSAAKSGLLVTGDAKGLARIETAKGPYLLATQNNDSLKSFALGKSTKVTSIKINPNEQFAIIFLKGHRSRKVEFGYGSTYLSQSSRSMIVNEQTDSVKIFNRNGELSRVVLSKEPLL
jgi:hypothetical protein